MSAVKRMSLEGRKALLAEHASAQLRINLCNSGLGGSVYHMDAEKAIEEQCLDWAVTAKAEREASDRRKSERRAAALKAAKKAATRDALQASQHAVQARPILGSPWHPGTWLPRVSMPGNGSDRARPARLAAAQRRKVRDDDNKSDQSETPSEVEIRMLGAMRSSTVTKVGSRIHRHLYNTELEQDVVRTQRVDRWMQTLALKAWRHAGDEYDEPTQTPLPPPLLSHVEEAIDLEADDDESATSAAEELTDAVPSPAVKSRKRRARASAGAPKEWSFAKLVDAESVLEVDEEGSTPRQPAPGNLSPNAIAGPVQLLTSANLRVRDARTVEEWLAAKQLSIRSGASSESGR